MFFDSYERALEYLKDEYGGVHEVANATDLDVGGRWLHQTLEETARSPSEKVRRTIIDHAERIREKRVEEASSNPDPVTEKIKLLHDQYGSWDRVGRRIGADPNALRLAVTEGLALPKKTRNKVHDASRRSDLEGLIGFLCVGVGIQMVDALRDTDLSHDQQKIVDKGSDQLHDYHRLLQTGNMQELRDAIKESIAPLNRPQNGHDPQGK